MIQVCSEAGEILITPQERRRCPGRLLFRLAPQALDTPQEAQKAQGKSPCSEGEHGHSESEQGSSVSELRKANTTKETKDKSTPIGVQHEQRNGGEKAVDKSVPEKTALAANSAPDRAASDVRRFLLAYQELFARHSAQGEAPPLAWGRDSKLVKGLLAQYGYERLLELLVRFFQCEDTWAKKRGYALACFPTLLPALLMEEGRAQAAQRRAQATPVVVQDPSARHWQQAGDGKVSDKSLFERYPQLRNRVRGQPP